MIRYLFEGKIYKITILTHPGKRCWLIKQYADRVIIEKGDDVHIAAVMGGVDELIRDTRERIAKANTNSLYDMLEAYHERTIVGCL